MDETKLPDHIFRFVEAELYDYPVHKLTLNAAREDIIEEMPAAVGDITGVRGSTMSSPIERKVMRLMTNRRIERLEFMIRVIEDVLSAIPEEERRLVNLKYFDQELTNQGVARALGMSDSTFHRKRREVIRRFAIRMGLM